MSLETGTRIQDLVATNPVGATDFVSQGDDHLRLVKACVKGSFPSLGATAVAVAAEKINFLADVTSLVQAQLDAHTSALSGKQPLDSDLTAIAALTTTAFGRGLLALADAAALLSAAGVTLTAAQVNDAARKSVSNQFTLKQYVVTAAGAYLAIDGGGTGVDTGMYLGDDGGAFVWQRKNVPMLFGTNNIERVRINAAGGLTIAAPSSGNAFELSGNSLLQNGGTSARWHRITTTGADGFYAVESSVAGTTFTGSLAYAAIFGNNGNAAAQIVTNGIVRLSIGSDGAIKAPKIQSSTSTTLVAGQLHHITGNATLPALGDGDWVGIVNNSGSPITITEHSGDTTYWTATAASISTVTVPARGRIVASGAGSSVVYVSGDISGST
jgi:hypothetical protein